MNIQGGDEVAVKRVSTSVSLPPELVEAIDARRGYQSRSAWIVEAIQHELVRVERKGDPLRGVVKQTDRRKKDERH